MRIYQLHVSYGQGFKLPSFYSLADPLVGNPALLPETARAYEARIARDLTRGHIRASLSYFDNSYGHLIDFSPSIFKLVNREGGFSRGLDFRAHTRVHSFSLDGAATYVDAGLVGTTEHLRDVPRWTEEFHVQMALPKRWAVEIATTWVGRRFDYQVPVPQMTTVRRYTVTNANVTHAWTRQLSTRLRMENVLNSKYQEFVGFPSPGIYASAGVFYSR